jgi:hydrogenase maturation protease
MSQSSPAPRAPRPILIAGIGNIFFADDGFGVEVAQRLLGRKTKWEPERVQVVDFGIRGIELAYTLLDDYDTLVLIDAVARGSAPGTLYVLEPDLASIGFEQGVEAGRGAVDSHSMDPLKTLAFARTLGARPIRTLLVGCEPSALGEGEGDEEMQMGLSEPVQAAIDAAVKMIDSIVEDLLQ